MSSMEATAEDMEANTNGNNEGNKAESLESQRGQQKRATPPTSTATSPKKRKARIAIRKNCRVYTTRKQIYHILKEEQKVPLAGLMHHDRLYGTVVGGNGIDGYRVSFDLLPVGHKEVICGRKRVVTLAINEAEVANAYTDEGVAATSIVDSLASSVKSPMMKFMADFLEKATEELLTATSFQMHYVVSGSDSIDWQILGDTEHISANDDPLNYPLTANFKKSIELNDDNFDDVFFEHFFPSIEGHALLINKFNKSPESPNYEEEDPDWLVKQCYKLLVASVLEPETGTENLWKKGTSDSGRPIYANFGQFAPKDHFKVFLGVAAMVFGPKEQWFEDKRDKSWSMFAACLTSFNDKRSSLIRTQLLMLDESMSGWCPKTSQFGYLPNLTFEPRKPVPLGTQLKNGVECLTGMFVFQDVVEPVEIQQQKMFYRDPNGDGLDRAVSSLPTNPPMLSHAAEVLRQVAGAKVEKGGWCGGDAWFGSVMSVVELKKQLGVYSTFIVKNNSKFFPKDPLLAILKARHGNRMGGHWVVMSTEIAEVPLLAIAYAWSHNNVSYFISSCGSTEPRSTIYESKFPDKFGNVGIREFKRPEILQLVYNLLPLIHEHNRQRQYVLQIERHWPTRDPWFRLVRTLLGMSLVDMYRFHRYDALQKQTMTLEELDTYKLVKLCDTISKNLRSWFSIAVGTSTTITVRRIKNEDGRVCNDPTKDSVKAILLHSPALFVADTKIKRQMLSAGKPPFGAPNVTCFYAKPVEQGKTADACCLAVQNTESLQKKRLHAMNSIVEAVQYQMVCTSTCTNAHQHAQMHTEEPKKHKMSGR